MASRKERKETRSEYLLEQCRDARGLGPGPMGTHKTWVGTAFANAPVFVLSSCLLWGLALYCIWNPDTSKVMFKSWQNYVTDICTWLYIGSNGIWLFYIIGVYYWFGHVKLGKESDKPEFDDGNYFMMIFCAGIAIGLFKFGAAEPLYHYIEETGANRYSGAGYMNDNELAANAINLTLYHWGVHGWVVYTLTAVTLGVLTYRYDLPLTYRTCFFPLFGKMTWGWAGDLIDSVTIAGCVAGVCTSLGLGAPLLIRGFQRGGWMPQNCLAGTPDTDSCLSDQERVNYSIILIAIITLCATASVLTGLDSGIKLLSQVAFASGMFLWTVAFFLDDCWYLLNIMVQAFGFYIQWIMQLGWFTDAFGQLKWGEGRNLASEGANPSWMSWWTVFYWGWWIAWSPFVGVFLTRISKGRTIAEVINFTFSVPLIYTIIWFSTFGGAGIKMERKARLLQKAGQELHGDENFFNANLGDRNVENCYWVPEQLTCPPHIQDLCTADACGCPAYSNHYTINGDGERVDASGTYSTNTNLSPVCRFVIGPGLDDSWYDVMAQYHGLGPVLINFSLFTILLYFVTSSDSGSLVVDYIACNGEEAHPVQRVYWAFTEGGLAMALLYAGGNDALSALQSISIVGGVPFTVFVCLICISLQRVLMYDQGLLKKGDYETWEMPLYGGILDYLEFFFSFGHAPRPHPYHIGGFIMSTAFPPYYMHRTLNTIPGRSGVSAPDQSVIIGATMAWVGFICSVLASFLHPNFGFGGIAAFCYMAFSCTVVMIRSEVRTVYNIEGGPATDVLGGVFMYNQAVWQSCVQASMPVAVKAAKEPKGLEGADEAGQVPSMGGRPSNKLLDKSGKAAGDVEMKEWS